MYDPASNRGRAPAVSGALSPRDLASDALAAAPARATPRLDLDVLFGQASPDRLSLAVTAYLLLPGLIFLAGWAQPWAGLLAGGAALASLALSPGWRQHWPLGRGMTALCLGLGLLWAGGSGAHHLLYSAADWQIRDAVLRDLALGPWPIAYHVAGEPAELLRAPLGYFLPAALVGRLAGFGAAPGAAQAAAQAALWAWTGLGLGLVLMLLASLARVLRPERPGAAFALLAGVFALFHGLDLLPNMLLDGLAGIGPFGGWQRGGEWWARWFQYPGAVTSLLWAPNHALPPWLLTLLLLRHGGTAGFPRGLALPLAAGAFWSPIGTAGATLLAVVALLGQGWRALRGAMLAPANWLAACFALPVCLYLLAGADEVPHAALLAEHPLDLALGRWGLFLLVEVLCWAIPTALLLRGRLFLAAVGLLCLLPLYVFGPGNEMASRGSLAALAVLAIAAAAGLLRPAATRGQRLARMALLACFTIGLGGAAMEASLLTRPAWPASRSCAVPEAARQSVFRGSTDWSHYFAPWPDAGLQAWLRPPGMREVPAPGGSPRCWPGRGV